VANRDNRHSRHTMEDQALFRLFNPLSPTTRRTARALQDIQTQRGIFAIDEIRITNNPVNPLTPLGTNGFTTNQQQIPRINPTTPETTNNQILRFIHTPDNPIPRNMTNTPPLIPERRRLSGNFDDSLTQNQSPDEAVIQARGRRQIPLTFSPDINHTPLRQQMQRAKLTALSQGSSTGSRLLLPTNSQTRTSPRKRLTLTDTPPSSITSCFSQVYTPSPDKLKISPLTKKVKIDPLSAGIEPEMSIKGLSQDQLVNLLSSVLQQHPEIREEVHEMIPTPDLTPLEEKLNYLKRNIYKALPSTRLESKTDSLAYNRVSLHLISFKKSLLDAVKSLLDSHQWLSVIDYTVMAWQYVKDTPVWENPSHNNIRKTCFKSLAASCMTALKKGDWSENQKQEVRDKLVKLKLDSEEIVVCIKYLEENQH